MKNTFFIHVQLEIKKDNTLNEGSIHDRMNSVKFYLRSLNACIMNQQKLFFPIFLLLT